MRIKITIYYMILLSLGGSNEKRSYQSQKSGHAERAIRQHPV